MKIYTAVFLHYALEMRFVGTFSTKELAQEAAEANRLDSLHRLEIIETELDVLPEWIK